jgi:hypothetical protein
MRLPRWLTYLFPRLLPQGRWADAVIVTNPKRLAALDAIYAQRVAWVRSIRPDAIQTPDRLVTFRVWPKHLKPPRDFGLGKVLSPYVIQADWHGTLLVRESLVDDAHLIAHECIHAITGISDHPKDLFPT